MKQGIAFRANVGYVTDGADDQFYGSNTADFPITSSQGNSIGYTAITGGVSIRDRDNTVDPRIAGCHFAFNAPGTLATCKIQLPSTGAYLIRVAVGDMGGPCNPYIELFDNATSFKVISGATSWGALFFDANGNALSHTDWPSMNTTLARTFASTSFNITIGDNSGGGDVSALAYVYIESVAGNNTVTVPLGTLVLAGQVPVVVSSSTNIILVPLGTLTATAQIPVIGGTLGSNIVVVPLADILMLDYEPTVVASSFAIQPPVPFLTLAAFAPTVFNVPPNPQIIVVPSLSLAFGSLPPIVSDGAVIVITGTSNPGGGGGGGHSGHGSGHGGGGKHGINIDSLDTFTRLDKKLAKGMSLREAIDNIETPEEDEFDASKPRSKRSKRALITEISEDEIEILIDEYYKP